METSNLRQLKLRNKDFSVDKYLRHKQRRYNLVNL